jgi:hypothetical protein
MMAPEKGNTPAINAGEPLFKLGRLLPLLGSQDGVVGRTGSVRLCTVAKYTGRKPNRFDRWLEYENC